LFHTVGFKQANPEAVAQVSIELLYVEALAAVINLIDVSGFSSEHGQEANDLQESQALLPFGRPSRHRKPVAMIRLETKNRSTLC